MEKIARLGWFLLCVIYSLYDQLLTFFQQNSCNFRLIAVDTLERIAPLRSEFKVMGEAFKWRLISREAFKIGFATLNYLQIFLFMVFPMDLPFRFFLFRTSSWNHSLFSLIFREFYIFLLNLSQLLFLTIK